MLSDPDFQAKYTDFLEEEMAVERVHRKARQSYEPRIHPDLKNLMMDCKVLTFPQLLPLSMFRTTPYKVPFFRSEEKYVAISLLKEGCNFHRFICVAPIDKYVFSPPDIALDISHLAILKRNISKRMRYF